jgi:hypothetical protein
METFSPARNGCATLLAPLSLIFWRNVLHILTCQDENAVLNRESVPVPLEEMRPRRLVLVLGLRSCFCRHWALIILVGTLGWSSPTAPRETRLENVFHYTTRIIWPRS